VLPRRIAFVAGTLGKGGAEQQLYYQVVTLKRAGTDVAVISLTRGEYWEAELKRAGVEVLFAGDSGSRLNRMLRVGSLARDFRPDVVQSAHFYTNIYVWFAGRCAGVPSIGAVRSDCRSEVRAHAWPMGVLCLMAPKWIAANSREAVGAAEGYGRKRESILYLPNVIDTDRFQPKRYSEAPDEIRLIWCGRMIPGKRPEWFVRLIYRLRKKGVAARGWMVGDGPLLHKIRDLVRTTEECAGCIDVVGGVTDTAPWYEKADMLILTSDHEGTPNVILEAMSSGLAVVTTPVGSVQELLGEHAGKCVAKTHDEDGLLKAVYGQIEDPAQLRAMQRALRQRAVKHWDVKTLPSRLEALYSMVVR